MKKYTASIQQMAELQEQRELANKEEKESYKVKKQTFDLLPNAEENIVKLQVLLVVGRLGKGWVVPLEGRSGKSWVVTRVWLERGKG